MPHRVTVEPKPAVLLAIYMDVTGLLAGSCGQGDTARWIAYDKQHRMFTSQNSNDLDIGTKRHDRFFYQNFTAVSLEGSMASANQLLHPLSTASTNCRSTVKCNSCYQLGHLGRDRRKDQRQLFRGRNTADAEVCFRFNRGQWNAPCRHNRFLVCQTCGQDPPATQRDEAARSGGRRV